MHRGLSLQVVVHVDSVFGNSDPAHGLLHEANMSQASSLSASTSGAHDAPFEEPGSRAEQSCGTDMSAPRCGLPTAPASAAGRPGWGCWSGCWTRPTLDAQATAARSAAGSCAPRWLAPRARSPAPPGCRAAAAARQARAAQAAWPAPAQAGRCRLLRLRPDAAEVRRCSGCTTSARGARRAAWRAPVRLLGLPGRLRLRTQAGYGLRAQARTAVCSGVPCQAQGLQERALHVCILLLLYEASIQARFDLLRSQERALYLVIVGVVDQPLIQRGLGGLEHFVASGRHGACRVRSSPLGDKVLCQGASHPLARSVLARQVGISQRPLLNWATRAAG